VKGTLFKYVLSPIERKFGGGGNCITGSAPDLLTLSRVKANS
jgi:hypothetical protein